MTDPDYRRDLARIENKLDRVENAIVSLARMEERMVTLFNRVDGYDQDQRDVLRRVFMRKTDADLSCTADP